MSLAHEISPKERLGVPTCFFVLEFRQRSVGTAHEVEMLGLACHVSAEDSALLGERKRESERERE